MVKKIRFGIVGCSSIADRAMLPVIRSSDIAELRMIASRSATKAKKFAKKFSCPLYGCYEEVLERDDIDAVYISLPIALQEKWISKAAKHGKHIICEKSATNSFKSAQKIVKDCKKNGVRILEGFMFRFHPQHKEVLKFVKQMKIGKVFSFNSTFGFTLKFSPKDFRLKKELGGGILNDVGCYPICASRIIFQDKPSWILCNLIEDKKFNVDVQGGLIMKYPNQKIAQATFGYNNFFQSQYSIWGNKGIINVERAYNVPKNMKVNINLKTKNQTKKIKFDPVDQFQLMVSNFCKTLRIKQSEFNYENDLFFQAKIMEAARQSNIKKRPIKLNEIK